MIQPITKERWQEAQIAEAGYHANAQATAEHYRRSYETYFRYLGMSFDQEGKIIIEIGPADYPALSYCENVGQAVIIEPLVTETLKARIARPDFLLIARPLEDMSDLALPHGAECWLLNVMQHIQDPELFVEKCKQIAPVIRFFEPIDFGISDCHPHTYSIDDFIRWFGHAERYKGGSDEGFHTADCAYGTWRA